MTLIKKLKRYQKLFQIKRNKKIKERNTKYNKIERKNKKSKVGYKIRKKAKFKEKKISLTAPKDFSIVNNTNAVLSYFKEIIDKTLNTKTRIIIDFNLESVETISVDAIMYMLAIVRNLKEKKYQNIRFKGSSPVNPDAKKIFMESGFLNYVNTNSNKIVPISNKIQIRSAKEVDTTVIKEICDLVNHTFGTNKNFTYDLYPVLVELSNNSVQHAYNKKSVFSVSNWYLSAEERNDEIHFVLLDTGEGIPTTVNRRFSEKLLSTSSDSQLIKSALKGEGRTQTRQENRGKGLPRVAQACTKGNLFDLIVYSGRGSCKIIKNNNETIVCEDYREQLYGTLFTWKMKKPT